MYDVFLLFTLATFGLIAWRSRTLAIVLVAAVLPTYLLRFSVAGIPVTLLEGLILVLVAAWIVRGEWKRVRNVPRIWLLASGVLLLTAFVATAVSADQRAALGVLKAYFVEPTLLFLVAATTIKTAEEKERVLLAFGLGAAAASLFGFFQVLTGMGIPIPWDIERRATGVFPYPNALGLYAGPAAVIAVFRAFHTSVRRRALWVVIAVLCAGGVLVAQSEAAAAALLATLFLSSLASPRLRRWTIPAVAAVAVVLAAVPFTRNSLWQKITFQDRSEQVRLVQWAEAWNLLKDRPVFGAGLAGYPAALVPYHLRPDLEIFQYPHTLLFNIWSELGLLGLGAVGFLAWTTIAAIRAASRPLPPPQTPPRAGGDSAIVFAAFAALLASSIHGLVDVAYFKNDLSALTWLLLALICVSSSYGRYPTRTDR